MIIEGWFEASRPINAGPCVVTYAIEVYADGTRRRSGGGVVVKYTRSMPGARFGAWWRNRWCGGRIS